MREKQKILHLVDSSGLYGAETVILNLSKEMENSSFSPIVGMICQSHAKLPEVGVAAQKLGLPTTTFSYRSRFDPACSVRIYHYLKANNVAVVHSHGYKPSIMAYLPCRFVRRPLLITCHLWFNSGDRKLQIYHKLETMIMKRIPAVVGVSEEICDEIMQQKVAADQVRLIHNGINLSHYRKYDSADTQKMFQNMGISENDFVVGSIGRLHEQKGFSFLLEAVKILKQKGRRVKCVIFGEGPLRAELEKRRHELGLEGIVQLPGFRGDSINLLEFMDVFVISSVDEGLPMVLLEAMAKRRAIISTPVGAIDSVLTHEKDALLFDVGDVAGLAENIVKLQENPIRRHALGEAAYQRFSSKFSSARMAGKYLDIYRELAETPYRIH